MAYSWWGPYWWRAEVNWEKLRKSDEKMRTTKTWVASNFRAFLRYGWQLIFKKKIKHLIYFTFDWWKTNHEFSSKRTSKRILHFSIRQFAYETKWNAEFFEVGSLCGDTVIPIKMTITRRELIESHKTMNFEHIVFVLYGVIGYCVLVRDRFCPPYYNDLSCYCFAPIRLP